MKHFEDEEEEKIQFNDPQDQPGEALGDCKICLMEIESHEAYFLDGCNHLFHTD